MHAHFHSHSHTHTEPYCFIYRMVILFLSYVSDKNQLPLLYLFHSYSPNILDSNNCKLLDISLSPSARINMKENMFIISHHNRLMNYFYRTELIRRLKRYRVAQYGCLIVKYAGDTRYTDNGVATHDRYFCHI